MSDSVNNNAFLRNNVTHSTSSSSLNRPSLLTSKLAATSSSSTHQLASVQQQQQQQQQYPLNDSPNYPYPNPKTASFRNSFLKSSANHPNPSSSLSSSITHDAVPSSFSFPNRSSNISIQQPSTSQHFKHSEVVNSFTPFHNTPSVVSSSYSSASNSVPTHFNPSTSFHKFPQPSASIPTTTVSTESAQPNEFSRPLQSSRASTATTEIPQEPQLQPDQEPPQYSEPMFSSSLSEPPTYLPTNNENHLDIVNHPVDDLLMMLSALLQKIVEANDNLHPHHYHHASQLHNSHRFTANVLAFHGRNVPAISLHAYLTRILKYCPVTNEVFLTLLVYFDRIAKRANAGDFDQNKSDPGNSGSATGTDDQQLFVMDSYNIHRLIIAGITVASKFFSDIFYKNSRYAKVGGLPLEELNHLELQFLLLTDFKLMIQIEELQRYADLLLKFWKREQSKAQEKSEDQDQGQNLAQ